MKGNVYVHYVDTEGKTIKASVTDEKDQPVDKDYDTVVDNRPQEIEFEGKTYEFDFLWTVIYNCIVVFINWLVFFI